jgi:VanZ family protein
MAGRYSRSLAQDVAREAVGSSERLRAWGAVLLCATVCIATVCMILSQSGFSAVGTGRILGPLLQFIGVPPEHMPAAQFLVRKTAHVVEYAVLAFFAARAAVLSIRPTAAMAVAFVVALGVAALDEWNQSRIPSRTGTPRDVALDLGGALLGGAVWSVRRALLR